MLGENKQIDFSYLDGSSYYYYEDDNVFIKAFYYLRNDNKETSWDDYIIFKVEEGEHKNNSVLYNIKKDTITDHAGVLNRYPYIADLIREYYVSYNKYKMEVD